MLISCQTGKIDEKIRTEIIEADTPWTIGQWRMEEEVTNLTFKEVERWKEYEVVKRNG